METFDPTKAYSPKEAEVIRIYTITGTTTIVFTEKTALQTAFEHIEKEAAFMVLRMKKDAVERLERHTT